MLPVISYSHTMAKAKDETYRMFASTRSPILSAVMLLSASASMNQLKNQLKTPPAAMRLTG